MKKEEGKTGSLHHEAIARRAHALWLERGKPEGEAEAHWLAAEAELRAAGGGEDKERTPRNVEDPTPITLDDEDPRTRRPARGASLPPPHQGR